jgi:hypothetical protein
MTPDRGDDQIHVDPQHANVVAAPSPQPARPTATASVSSLAADHLATDHTSVETQTRPVGGDPLDPGHHGCDNPREPAGVDPSAAAHRTRVTQTPPGGGSPSESPVHPTLDAHWPSDGWLELRTWCEQLEDAMAARIAATNRVERGGVEPDVYLPYLEALRTAEHVCELHTRRCYRRVVPPEIRAWQLAERGIGEKLTARLLGHLGDPCIAVPHRWEGTGSARHLLAGTPNLRTVSQLRQYCGVGDPHRRKTKDMTADEAFALGNPKIKMLMRLHAEACIKTTGHYREVYDKARAEYVDKAHTVDCPRCGPTGKPALVGTPWSKGHQHAAALRKVAKEILRDLWRVRYSALSPSANVGSTSNPCPPMGEASMIAEVWSNSADS